MNDHGTFGASATVRILFDGTLRQLAQRLEEALSLRSFPVAPSEHPPHEDIGSAETLGFELWLTRDAVDGSFVLEIETQMLQETIDGRTYDLSPWLSRLVATMSGIETEAVQPSGNDHDNGSA